MLAAASVGAAAEAVRLEQRLEDAILKDAVSTIGNKALNREEKAARLVELASAVQRDKRAVEALSGLLGASSGVSKYSIIFLLYIIWKLYIFFLRYRVNVFK